MNRRSQFRSPKIEDKVAPLLLNHAVNPQQVEIMSASTLEITEVSQSDQRPGGADPFVRRSAFYIEGHSEPIFAWLHRRDEGPVLDHGVIVCPPFGHEQLHSHRSLRHLADSLALAKIATLRFDWHGAGDSPGYDEDPDRYATWLANVSDAATWMRKELGCRQVSLIGLRLGATLACLATQQHSVDNLVLWSPVVKGRSYVREMRAVGLTSDAPKRSSEIPSNDIESGGFVLSTETASQLGGIDLFQSVPKCRRLLVVSRSDLPEDDRLCQHYTRAGLDVRQIACPGYTEMMLVPHRTIVPRTAITMITEWTTQAIQSDASVLTESSSATRVASVTMTAPALDSNPADHDGQICEMPVRLSSDPDLFGIVSEPATGAHAMLPTVVLFNTGSAHRVGVSRLNVLLGRQLAGQGFRCLRMDFSGLGDSVSDDPTQENDAYTPTMFRDIDLALKQVERQFGTSRFVLMGLCSGGYAAFQAAAQIPHPGIVEAVVINPLTFFWTAGMTLETSPTRHWLLFPQYQRAMLDPGKWWKLLTGQSKLGIRGALDLAAARLGLKRSSTAFQSPQKDGIRSHAITHPVREDLPGDLKRIERANRHLAMFFATSDPGFSILNGQAKRSVNKLRASGRLDITMIEEADHTFTVRSARNEVINSIAAHLKKRYQ